MANEKFRVLRREMQRHGLDAIYAAELCGCSPAKMYNNLNGNAQWALKDIYIIMDAMNMPYVNIPVLFPKDGMYAGEIGEYDKSPATVLGETIIKAVKEAKIL